MIGWRTDQSCQSSSACRRIRSDPAREGGRIDSVLCSDLIMGRGTGKERQYGSLPSGNFFWTAGSNACIQGRWSGGANRKERRRIAQQDVAAQVLSKHPQACALGRVVLDTKTFLRAQCFGGVLGK